MHVKEQEKYQTYFRATEENETGEGEDVITLQLDFEGQVSSVEIFGPDAQDFRIETQDYDPETGTPDPTSRTEKYYLNGNSTYDVGDFEDPLFTFGAAKQINVVTSTALSADDYGINIRVDELKG